MVSYLGSRRTQPPWWTEATWKAADDVNRNILPTYYEAKLAADEALYEASKKRAGFVGINLRPGTLTDEAAERVELGKTNSSEGKISRESVAKVAALLLESEGIKNTWLDLLNGDEEPEVAVSRVVRDGVNAAEGDSVY